MLSCPDNLYCKDLVNGIVLIITTCLLNCSSYQLFRPATYLIFLKFCRKGEGQGMLYLITMSFKTKRKQNPQNQIKKNPPMPNQINC